MHPCRVLVLTIGWIIFLSSFIPVHFLLKGHDKLRKRIEVLIHLVAFCYLIVSKLTSSMKWKGPFWSLNEGHKKLNLINLNNSRAQRIYLFLGCLGGNKSLTWSYFLLTLKLLTLIFFLFSLNSYLLTFYTYQIECDVHRTCPSEVFGRDDVRFLCCIMDRGCQISWATA